MASVILTFMKALEAAIPPPLNCHHAITYSQYGSDETGWEDRLALQVNVKGVFTCFFIEEGDLENPGTTIDTIIRLLNEKSPKAQLGVALGQYVKQPGITKGL